MTLGLCTSIALILFLVELRLPPPAPIPGVKLGLANIVTLYAVYRLRPSDAVLITAARILLGAFFAGQATVLFYSVTGAVFCLAGSFLLRRVVPEKFLPVSSAIAAVLHNTGQLTAAALILGTTSIFLWFPYLLVSGIATGLATGITARLFLRRESSFRAVVSR